MAHGQGLKYEKKISAFEQNNQCDDFRPQCEQKWKEDVLLLLHTAWSLLHLGAK